MHIIVRSLPGLAALSVLAALLVPPARAETNNTPSGYVDFGTFTPPSGGGEFVEVNLHGALLQLASRIVAKDEPEVAKLIANLHAVRVNVIGIDDENRDDLARRAASIHGDLTNRGWQKVVTVRQEDDDVGVYLKLGADDMIEGVVVTVLERSGEAVFVNVVGNIHPDQLAALGERLGIEPLKRAGKAAGV